MSEKPKNIDEYKKWLKEQHKVDITTITQTYYESVTTKIESTVKKSEFWTQLTENLQEYNDEYLVERGYHLLMPPFPPELYTKPFDSFILKTFRKNVLENENWPEMPEKGWALPHNWYSSINDIIRTLITVKYLDGVEFLIDKIDSLCEHNKLDCHVSMEAKEEGYYAAHLYTIKECEIPKVDWDTERVNISLEIQITTQLQEAIRKLLHKYYEERRKRIVKEDVKWQWNYKDNEFVANYLGHILHYVEGMIMEIRDKQREEEEKYERRV